jgi:tetratricopeptide (TPR) repeat protein
MNALRPTLLSALLLVSALSVIAQDLRKRAEENPLSTVMYLLSTTDKDDEEEEKACLAKSLASVDRFAEVQSAADMIERESYVDKNLIDVVRELVSRGKDKEASTLLSFLLERFANDEYHLEMLVRPMILLKREAELEALIDKLDDSDKIDLWFKAADVYREVGNPEKALQTLEKTVAIAKSSEYASDRSGLALRYARLGRESEALQLLESLSNDPQLKQKAFRVVHDVADAYRALGRYSEAYEIHRQYDDGLNIDETWDLITAASRSIAKGDRPKALDLLARALAQLDPNEYGDSFNLGNIIELYLKIGEIQKAEQVARSITGSDYIQQENLLSVADRYSKAGNKTKTREILRFALEQTNKIDTSEAESGSLWTSGKWDQARFQSQIAIRYMDLRDDKEALWLTALLRKPYLRALILTEYVAINKKRIAAKKLAPHLEEAIVLLRRKKIDIFDSKKFDVYAIAARNFAEIGLAKRANEVFAETLTELDRYVIDEAIDSTLLYAMCNIGVDFNRSGIKADENVKTALRKIIKNWEDGEY